MNKESLIIIIFFILSFTLSFVLGKCHEAKKIQDRCLDILEEQYNADSAMISYYQELYIECANK